MVVVSLPGWPLTPHVGGCSPPHDFSSLQVWHYAVLFLYCKPLFLYLCGVQVDRAAIPNRLLSSVALALSQEEVEHLTRTMVRSYGFTSEGFLYVITGSKPWYI